LKGIKREKLYIFDKKIIPLAMFIKGLSTRLYKKVLRKVYRDDFAAYTNALIESGLSKREDLIKPISIGKPIKLKNSNCVITGAASGIGRYLSILLAKEGMNLFLSDIDMENLEKVKKEIEDIGVKVFAGKCDISKYEDYEKLANDSYSKLGAIDMVINNAGTGIAGFSETLDLEQWRKVLDVNLWGIIHAIKAFIPRMLKRGSGHFIITGSGAGIVGLPFHIPYVASKFAIVGIAEALYSELWSKGLNFSVICPTKVQTNIARTAEFKLTDDMFKIEDQQIIHAKMNEFKDIFTEEYFDEGITPDLAAKRYLKRIKKGKLYVFDKKILPVAMFIKSVSKRLYKKVLKRECKKDIIALNNTLSRVGLKLKKR
jgi:short-subunit dehydrogenase